MRIHNGHILGSTAFLVCGLGVFAPLGLAPLIGVAAAAATVAHYRKTGHWPRPPLTIAVIFGVLAVLVTLSLIWSINRDDTIVGLTRTLPLLVAGGLLVGVAAHLSGEETRAFVRLFVAGAAVALCLLAVERFAGAPIRHLTSPRVIELGLTMISFNRGVSVLALCIWPLALIVWRCNRSVAVALWLVTFALLATLENASALVALVLGAVVWLGARAAPRITPAAIAWLGGAIIVIAPLIPGAMPAPAAVRDAIPGFPSSAYHRLLIWGFTADHIADRPLLGWGMRTSRAIPGGKTMLDKGDPALPLHPHNGILQFWLELGVPGALIWLALLLSVVSLIASSRAPPVARAAALGMTVTGLTMISLSYGIWQSWWLAALWMTAAFMTAVVRAEAAIVEPTPDRVPAPSYARMAKR